MIDFTELLKKAVKTEIEATVNGPILAKVESFDSSNQTVDATPRVQKWIHGELQAPQVQRDVPCFFLKTSDVLITWKYSNGDDVFLVPCDRDISSWIASGSSSPGTKRRFSESDYVAFPSILRYGELSKSDFIDGLKAEFSELEIKATTKSTIESDHTNQLIGSPIVLGETSLEWTLKGQTVQVAFSSFLTSWQSALTPLTGAIDPIVRTYAGAMQTAITALQGTLPNWLSSVVKGG